jgi:hypothetical protein
VAAQGGEQYISRYDACNDRNVTWGIFDEVRSKRAERLLQELTRSNRSRNLTLNSATIRHVCDCVGAVYIIYCLRSLLLLLCVHS